MIQIAIRSDASIEIGIGHVMRCLALADALRELGAHCLFICRPHQGHLLDLIERRGHEILSLPMGKGWSISAADLAHASWLGTDWESDAEQSRQIIGQRRVDWLIVDHYALDRRWEKAMRAACKQIMVIDDLADREHDCDLLLDQNLVENLAHRYDELTPSFCKFLLGPKYAILPPVYSETRAGLIRGSGQVRRILVSFGGVDRHNLTGLTLDAFIALNRNDVTLDIVLSSRSEFYEEILGKVRNLFNINLYDILPSLAPLMAEADLVIGACGVTSWERCCLGVPSLVISLAENQKPIAEELDRQEIVWWLGHYDKITKQKIISSLVKVLNSGELGDWSEHCMSLVDGKGIDRIIAVMTANEEINICVRSAGVEDEKLLLDWANDTLVRRNSFNPDPIDGDKHHFWFQDRLSEKTNCAIYIATNNFGAPIGQVRFELMGEEWQIDYSLDRLERGKKLGVKILRAAINKLIRERNVKYIVGSVKKNNKASQMVFGELGFSFNVVDDYIKFTYCH